MASPVETLCGKLELAPFEPETWPGILAEVAALAGGWGGGLLGIGGDRFTFLNLSGVPPEVPAEYAARGGGDPKQNPRVAAGLLVRPMRVFAEPEVVSEDQRRRHPLYKEFLEPGGSHYLSGGVLLDEGGGRVAAVVRHTEAQGPLQTGGRETFQALLPHLREAVRLQMRLESRETGFALKTLQQLGVAAVLCDWAGRVVGTSAAAERLLQDGRALRLRLGRLAAVSEASDRDLGAALLRASGHVSVAAPRAGAVLLRDARGAPAGVADVAPLPASSNSIRTGARVLVTIGLPTPRTRDLLAQLGLTPAEQDVARALAAGATLAEIAGRRRVSVETVRSQLKSIYGKIGVRRQAELLTRLQDLM